MYLLIIPFVTLSILCFFSLYLFKSNPLPLILSAVISIFTSYFLAKDHIKESLRQLQYLFLSPKNIPQIILIVVLIGLLARVLSPMSFPIKIDNFTLLQFNGLGDYYKHLYTMVPLIHDGIPPKHPYFPPETMSYYFGFYTIPVAFSIIFSLSPTLTLFVFVLIVYTMAFTFLSVIFNKYLMNTLSRLGALILAAAGVGVDVIPISALVSKDPTNIIFNQTFLSGTGTQVINIYTTFLQSPQHFMAATLTIVLLHHLIKEKPNLILITLITTYILLSSVFIAITLLLWLFLAFIFYKHLRFTLIKSAVFCCLLLMPYFLILTSRQNILFFFSFQPFLFIKNLPFFLSHTVNSFITLTIQYGPILFITPLIFLLNGWYKQKGNLILFLGLLLPFVLTWFIKSPDFNDFAMRTTVPSQILLSLIFIYSLFQTRGLLQKILFLILIPTLLIGIFSFYLEYQKAWKNRKIIDPKTSELLLEVRLLPYQLKLAAIEKEDWVYYIPPLGFKQILNPHLRETSVSTTSKIGKEHGEYEVMAFNIFLNATTGKNAQEVIDKRNKYFTQMNEYFQKYPFDLLLMDNTVWVKKGKNPYTEIFNKLSVKLRILTPYFTGFEYSSLIEKLASHNISVTNKPTIIPILDHKLPLDQGFWFLVSCRTAGRSSLKLELDDYHQLFNHHIKETGDCVGNVFYLPQKENLQLSNTSTVDEVTAYPIITEP